MVRFLERVFALIRPYRFRFGLAVVCGMGAGLASPALVITVKVVIDVVFPGGEEVGLWRDLSRAPAFLQRMAAGVLEALPRWEASEHAVLSALVIALIPGVMAARGMCAYLNVYLMQWVAVRAIADLRTRLFQHLTHLSLAFFHRTNTGELMSRIGHDTAAVQTCIGNSLVVLVRDPVQVISLAVLLLSQHFRLTLFSMLVLPLCLVPIIVYARKVRRSSAALQDSHAELTSIMHETFTGNRIVKAYNLEERVQRQFGEATRRFIRHHMRIIRSQHLPGPLIEFMAAVGIAFIFYFAAFSGRVQMTPGDFFQFIFSVFLMYQPIKTLTKVYHQLEQARAASGRVFELLGVQPSVPEPARPVPLRSARADIQFDRVSFDYGDKLVLRDINLIVKAGQLLAFVGPSGSGKTTLTNLLLRFYDPQEGAVLIGGTDIRRVALAELRREIAVVTQETILFNDTIRNNIAVGRPTATDQEIIAAARHAFAHDFILETPQGYDTVAGEKGASLSGGQRQRLAIARAILRDAPILILDEATSALDSESERAVQAALERLMRGRTTFCIAHRLSTIQNASLIVVMDRGRIVQAGRHAELIQREGLYRKLYDLQFQT